MIPNKSWYCTRCQLIFFEGKPDYCIYCSTKLLERKDPLKNGEIVYVKSPHLSLTRSELCVVIKNLLSLPEIDPNSAREKWERQKLGSALEKLESMYTNIMKDGEVRDD